MADEHRPVELCKQGARRRERLRRGKRGSRVGESPEKVGHEVAQLPVVGRDRTGRRERRLVEVIRKKLWRDQDHRALEDARGRRDRVRGSGIRVEQRPPERSQGVLGPRIGQGHAPRQRQVIAPLRGAHEVDVVACRFHSPEFDAAGPERSSAPARPGSVHRRQPEIPCVRKDGRPAHPKYRVLADLVRRVEEPCARHPATPGQFIPIQLSLHLNRAAR